MKKIILIGTIAAIIVIGGLFWYDWSSQKKNLELCLKTEELDFKEAWNDQCSALGLDWNCNLSESPEKTRIEKALDEGLDKCYDKPQTLRSLHS